MRSIKNYFQKTRTTIKVLTTNKEIKSGTINYILNDDDMTAFVSNGNKAVGSIFIPRLIINDNKKYIVTKINRLAFNRSKIINITFSDDSELKIIENESFTNCPIQSISIPVHVTEIGDKAFYQCHKFHSIQFQPNSELRTIGKASFASTSIKNIEIPSNVIEIKDVAFMDSNALENIHIPTNSKLEIIGEQSFCGTKIKEFFISDHLKILKYGCLACIYLKDIKISSKNKNFVKIFDGKLLLSKTDIKSDDFDIITWSKPDINQIIIPKYIKKIDAFAFNSKSCLRKVSFQEDSNLDSIGEDAFGLTPICSVSIPKSVNEIRYGAFSFCENLKIFEIPEETHLKSISWDVFMSTHIEILMFPANLSKISNDGTQVFFDLN